MPAQNGESPAELCKRLFSLNQTGGEPVKEPQQPLEYSEGISTASHAEFSPESVRHHWAPQFRPNTLPAAPVPTRKTKTTIRVKPLRGPEGFSYPPPILSTQNKTEWHAGDVQGSGPSALSTSLEPKPRQPPKRPLENLTSQDAQPSSPQSFVLSSSSQDTQREAVAAAHRALVPSKLTGTLPPMFPPSAPGVEQQTLGCASPAMATPISPHSRPSYRFPCRSSSCVFDHVSVPGHDCIFDTNIWLRQNPLPRNVHGGSRSFGRATQNDAVCSAFSRSGRAGTPTGSYFPQSQDDWSHHMCGWLDEREDVAQHMKEAEGRCTTISASRSAYLQARKKGEDHGLVVKKTHLPESEAAVAAQPSTPLCQGYLSKQTSVAESLDRRPPQVGQSLRDPFVQASNRHGSQEARSRSSAEPDQEALQDQTKCRRVCTHPNVSKTQHDVQYKYIPPSRYTRCTYGLARFYPSVNQVTHKNGSMASTGLPQASLMSAYTLRKSKPTEILAKVEATEPRKGECQFTPSLARPPKEVANEDTEASRSTNTSPVLTPTSTRAPYHTSTSPSLEHAFRMRALGLESPPRLLGPTPTRLPSRASSPSAITLDSGIGATVPLLPSPESPPAETYPHSADLEYEVVSHDDASSSADSDDDFAFEYEVMDADSCPSPPLSVSSGLH